MKNKGILISCVVTYLLFVLLIITEPIGYDPILLCVFFFIVFSLLFLFLTAPKLNVSDKIPRKLKALLYGMSTLIEFALIFILGWNFHHYWNSDRTSVLNVMYIALCANLTINAAIRHYKDYLKR